MIEFCGEISNEGKLYIQKKGTRSASLICLTIAVILCVPIIIATIMWEWACIIMMIPLILTVIVASIPQINAPMKLLGQYLPTRITINDEVIDIECKKPSQSKQILDVKKVIDLGDWYHLIFFSPHKSVYFLCQKNLITKGSLEEFEKLFEGKIEKTRL